MIWQIALPTFAIEKDILLVDDKHHSEVIVSGRKVYSANCESIDKCFKLTKKIQPSSNQSIQFSLCYQSGGAPLFAKLKNKNEKLSVCTKDQSVVDLNTLMNFYNETSN